MRVFVQVLGLISLSQCCWQPVCVHVCVFSVCVCLCAGPRLIDATSFDFPSVSCDGGLDGRPRWVSHKVFMSSVCLSVPLLLRLPTPPSVSLFVSALHLLCAKFVDGFYDQPQQLNSAGDSVPGSTHIRLIFYKVLSDNLWHIKTLSSA